MEKQVIDLLRRGGPGTGAEIDEALGNKTFALWKACMLSPGLEVRRIGRRYLRLDEKVDGYARLSPSMLREFLTYTIVGLKGDDAAIETRAGELQAHIQEVSRTKFRMASRLVNDIIAPVTPEGEEEKRFCVVLAGDIVYEMAHDVRRPERSTGMMVRGSDLDIVLIMSDEAPGELVRQLDEAIYRKKYQYLKNPAFREEIDYVIKPFGKLREQAEFDTYRKMVASKIFEESVFLYGSARIFDAGKAMLRERGVSERLRALERSAVRRREKREHYLLTTDERELRREDMYVFHTDHEAAEME